MRYRVDQGVKSQDQDPIVNGLLHGSHARNWQKKKEVKICDMIWAEFPEQNVALNFKQNKYTGCVEYVPSEDPVADSVPDVGGTGALLGLSMLAVVFLKRKVSE